PDALNQCMQNNQPIRRLSDPDRISRLSLFFFNVKSPTYIYTLSLHDALPILELGKVLAQRIIPEVESRTEPSLGHDSSTNNLIRDRKSTRLNSSHVAISYAVFCLKKKIQYQ